MFWGGKSKPDTLNCINKEFYKNKIWTVHLPMEMKDSKFFILEAWQEAIKKGFPDMLTQDQIEFSYQVEENVIPPKVRCNFAVKVA